MNTLFTEMARYCPKDNKTPSTLYPDTHHSEAKSSGVCRCCAAKVALFLADRVERLVALFTDTSAFIAIDSYDAQDAVSCLYHILQHYGGHLARPSTSSGSTAIIHIGVAMLKALQVHFLCTRCDVHACHLPHRLIGTSYGDYLAALQCASLGLMTQRILGTLFIGQRVTIAHKYGKLTPLKVGFMQGSLMFREGLRAAAVTLWCAAALPENCPCLAAQQLADILVSPDQARPQFCNAAGRHQTSSP